MAVCSSAGLSRTAATARFTSSAMVFAELLVLALALASSLALASVVGLGLGLRLESVFNIGVQVGGYKSDKSVLGDRRGPYSVLTVVEVGHLHLAHATLSFAELLREQILN